MLRQSSFLTKWGKWESTRFLSHFPCSLVAYISLVEGYRIGRKQCGFVQSLA